MVFVKKNLLSLICATIALIAIIATFFPLGGYFTAMRTTMTARAQDVGKIDRLMKQPRVLPAIDLRNLQARPLEQFPTQKVIDWGTHQAGDLKKAADQMFKKAVEINSNNIQPRTPRAALVDGVLPAPTGNPGPAQINFRNAYDDLMRSFAPPVPAATGGATGTRTPGTAEPVQPPGKLVERLRATKPVTAEEIKAEHDRIVEDVKSHKQEAQGQIVNQGALDEELAIRTASLDQKMHVERSKNFMIYLDSTGLYYNPSMFESKRAGTPPAMDAIWNAQVQAWLQDDVVQAIIDTNGADSNIQTAVVKRLTEMHPREGFGFEASANATGAAASAAGSSGSTGKYATNPTGRSTNAMYDVVRFSFIAYLDATRMLQFNSELGHNRFINVIQMDIVAVDRAADQVSSGYFYGDAPVVKVTYECEALFLRDWTKKWMPKEIKDRLGVADDRSADGR